MSIPDNPHGEGENPRSSFLVSRPGFVFIGFAIVAGALLFTEHRAHVLGVLIWLPLLACAFMHFFMHRDHEGHGRPADERKRHD